MSILVTGGAGFIGSHLVRYLLENTEQVVINLDALTYAANRKGLQQLEQHPRHRLEPVDLVDGDAVAKVLERHRPRVIFHLAAESHVDRSIAGPDRFVHTNVVGTFNLLQSARDYWRQLPPDRQQEFRWVHVSTDEVYGSLDIADPPIAENTRYDPRSPYAASKASGDHLVTSWYHTYRLPVILTHSTNNFGPGQHPEKLIPKTITRALTGEPIPIYGRGDNIRDWIDVADHVRALRLVWERGRPGESYHIGAGQPKSNLELVQRVLKLLTELSPPSDQVSLSRRGITDYAQLIRHVDDRPGHDFRYALDTSKIQNELGWQPASDFDQAMRATVAWYVRHRDWWESTARDDEQEPDENESNPPARSLSR